MNLEKTGYYALRTGNTLEFLLSGISAVGAIFSVAQKQYELGGVLAFISLYVGADAYGHRQDIEINKYRNEARKSNRALDEAFKRNNDAFDKFFDKTSKAP